MAVIETSMLNDKTQLVTLNRPKKLNALVPSLLTELIGVMQAANRSREIRCLVITGAGRGFCSGADLAQGADEVVPGTEGMSHMGYVYKYQELLAECMLAINECDKPVIAAVNGAAVGGGLAIALASDFRVASTKAKFGSVFIKTGLSSCDVGTSYFLPRLVPPTIAHELMATGRVFPATEAQEIGLLNKLVEPEELLAAAEELANKINANSEFGVWMTKKGFWTNMGATSLRQAMELENRTQVLGSMSGVMDDAFAAFSEGREPQWKPL